MKISRKLDLRLAIFFLAGSLIFLFYKSIIEYRELKDFSAFTVGKTVGFRYGGQTGRYVKYQYCIDGKKYQSEQDYRKWAEINREGGKYIVLYSEKNPRLNMIFFEEEATTELCIKIQGKSISNIDFNYWRVFWTKGYPPPDGLGVPNVDSRCLQQRFHTLIKQSSQLSE